MSNLFHGLLFLHGHIVDPRVLAPVASPKPAVAREAQPAPAPSKWKRAPRPRRFGDAPRAA